VLLSPELIQAARDGDLETLQNTFEPPPHVHSSSTTQTLTLLSFPNINDTDSHGQTLLHFAAENGRVDVMAYLLKHPDINVHLTNNVGETALFLADHGGHETCAKLLRMSGAYTVEIIYSNQRVHDELDAHVARVVEQKRAKENSGSKSTSRKSTQEEEKALDLGQLQKVVDQVFSAPKPQPHTPSKPSPLTKQTFNSNVTSSSLKRVPTALDKSTSIVLSGSSTLYFRPPPLLDLDAVSSSSSRSTPQPVLADF
jgi:hypothetical protein